MFRKMIMIASILASAGLALVAGCSDSPTPKHGDASAPEHKKHASAQKIEEHGHKPGTYGGIIVPLGRDSYHAEVVFEKGGVLRLYTLGKDEARVQEVDSQTLKAFARTEGEEEAIEFELKAVPQPGDSAGKTSLFMGPLPKELVGMKVEIIIPSLRVGQERFRLSFTSARGHDDMPAGVEGKEARQLYLSPGGVYTQEDIQANGNVTAGQKHRAFKAKHDLKPKVGDKICPVTLTKANPECTWIVGGKKYEFCCPPCIDEFVGLAKEMPADIKEPEYYVKRK